MVCAARTLERRRLGRGSRCRCGEGALRAAWQPRQEERRLNSVQNGAACSQAKPLDVPGTLGQQPKPDIVALSSAAATPALPSAATAAAAPTAAAAVAAPAEEDDWASELENFS